MAQTHEQMLPVSASELFKAIPGMLGIHLEEHADYEVVRKLRDIEVRAYAQARLARVKIMGGYQEGKDDAFVKLANYIHGNNLSETKMEMTTPVLLEKTESGWWMSFFLPKKFHILVPKPTDPAVHVEEVAARTFAVISYSGVVTEEKMAEKLTELQANAIQVGLHAQNDTQMTAIYDQPFAVPFLKRNEAMLEVRTLG